MLDKNVKELLNSQINKELYSAYLYLGFADYCQEQGLDGFANWYEIQAKEETDHAMLFRTYLQNNAEKVTLEAIDKPQYDPKDLREQLLLGLSHEQYVTGLINTIYKAAVDVSDYRTMQFLDWFVKEQGEEEKNADDLIKKYDVFGQNAMGLYSLNAELRERTYSEPDVEL